MTIQADTMLQAGELADHAGPPTVVFLGVDTAGSSIHHVFPTWAPIFAPGAMVRGLDLPEDATPRQFRDAVAAMSANPAIVGAVVTSHKLRLYRACHDIIDADDPFVAMTHEINCLDLRGQPTAYARDPVSLDALMSKPSSPLAGATSVVCIGAGGSATALLLAIGLDVNGTLTSGRAILPDDQTRRLTIIGRSQDSLDAIDRVRSRSGIPSESVSLVRAAGVHAVGEIVSAAPAGSLVINATGLGKTAPGSPLPGPAAFPPGAVAWDFNYRGPLTFLSQARAASLRDEDGWQYFVAGWSAALAAVHGIAFTQALLQKAMAAPGPQVPSR